jgi:ATP-dependent Zn protease
MVLQKKIKLNFSFSLLARIITTLGGRVRNKLFFGDPEITTVQVVIYNKLQIARQMVTRYGMSILTQLL